MPGREWGLCLLLSALLLALYTAVYLSSPATIDGDATLAVSTRLLKDGSPDISVLGSADGLLPPESRMGSFGLDGHYYAKKGVVPSLLLLPLVTLAQVTPAFSLRAAAMLFNPIVITLTALGIYTFARRLDYRPRIAFVAGLIYGAATFAVAYVQTLFGEPLAGLLLLIAALAAHQFRDKGDTRALLFCGTALGLLCGVNFSYALLAPLVGFYTFGLNPRGWRFAHLVRMALPFLLILAALLLFNQLRFGNPLSSGYHFTEGEGFNSPLLLGIFGLLLSPYRGILWYSPVLLLAIPGAWLFRRQRPGLTALILALLAAQTLSYASWWSWHGGFVWGPRFLLPVLPLLILLLLPILRRPNWRVATLALALLSLLIQIPALLYDFVPYTLSLYENYAAGVAEGFFTGLRPEVYSRVDLSPILGQIQLMLAGDLNLRPALLASGLNPVHLLIIGVLLAVGVVAFVRSQKRFIWAAVPVMLLCLLAVAGLQSTNLALAQAITTQLEPAEQIFAATTDYSIEWVDIDSPARVFTSNAPTTPDDPLAAGLWSKAMQGDGLFWFITWFPPASPENWQERDLWQRASFVRATTLNEDRALLFDLNPPTEASEDGGWRFGPIELTAYGMAQDPAGLRLTLAWATDAPLSQEHTWFVHLIDADGQIVQQQDRAPQGGYAPTSGWSLDETVLDYLYFPVQADTSGWQLRIGWVETDSGDRLPTTNPDGQGIDEGFILLPVE